MKNQNKLLEKFKIYLILITSLLVMSLIGLVWSVVGLDPFNQTAIALTALYASCLAFVSSLIALTGFWARRRFGVREFLAQHFKMSLRQGILAGVLATGLLILQSQRMLTWLNTILLIAALVFLEFYFISQDKKTIQN